MLPRELAVLSNAQDFLFLAHFLLRDGQGEVCCQAPAENPSGPGLVCFAIGYVALLLELHFPSPSLPVAKSGLVNMRFWAEGKKCDCVWYKTSTFIC